MPLPTNILVLGLGELGTAILNSLSTRAPHTTKLTVTLRPQTISSPSASKKAEIESLRAQGISILAADISTLSLTSLTELFKPFDLIISALGFASGPGSQVKITRAVLDAKVPWYIPWQFGVDYDIVGRGSAQPVWDEQLDVRDLIRDPGQKDTEWTIISTGMFTSFLFEESFGVVLSDDGEVLVRALGGEENRVTVTSPGDIGRAVAEVVFDGDERRYRNQVVYTAGDTISYGRLAKTLEEVTGRTVRREPRSVEVLREELEENPEDVLRRYRVVFAEGKGVSWDKERSFNVQRGMEMQDARGWLKENLEKKGLGGK
ncbi:putative isoflavone oxidoreductase [Venustampulla echinocandica]|uniref:Putative isoflavone oxidoreductase n=1 Tax=Venustampulla echinocandica TaxID=2656787 RepID=A0A370TQB8_9HELO|nr:putative isoflavone oxidoreductase [Venustampulla echinocandica]RDL37727.1 putative isoflavone oxidoreductase [Venustampulla echinocandica]